MSYEENGATQAEVFSDEVHWLVDKALPAAAEDYYVRRLCDVLLNVAGYVTRLEEDTLDHDRKISKLETENNPDNAGLHNYFNGAYNALDGSLDDITSALDIEAPTGLEQH